MCYYCNQPGHVARNCFKRKSDFGESPTTAQSSVGENVQSFGGNRGRGRGGRGGGSIGTPSSRPSNQPQPQARVYAVTRQEAPSAPEIITGMFSVCGSDARVLIDPGSTCSFISYEFALHVHGKIEPLGYDISVSMQAGGVAIVNTVIRACPIVLPFVTMHADLIVITLREFDVILGMDWLSKNHAIVDCHTKEVVMDIDGQLKMVIVGERKVVPNCLISVVIAFHLIWDGCDAYLASVKDVSKASPELKDVAVVREFPECFLRNYQGCHRNEKLILK